MNDRASFFISFYCTAVELFSLFVPRSSPYHTAADCFLLLIVPLLQIIPLSSHLSAADYHINLCFLCAEPHGTVLYRPVRVLMWLATNKPGRVVTLPDDVLLLSVSESVLMLPRLLLIKLFVF